MKTYRDFLKEATKKEALDLRNDKVDIENTIKEVIKLYNTHYNAGISSEVETEAVKYVKNSLTFSLNKLLDLGLSAGAAKSIIEKIKKSVNDAGLGKSGNAASNSSRAEKIDRFLSQKHIGPISRK